MKTNFLRFIGFITALNMTLLAAGQVNHQTVLDEIAGKLLTDYAADTRQLIYLHHDKPYYAAGSTIWFRAYLLNFENHQPSLLSNKLYVDLVNENDSVVQLLLLNARQRELDGGMAIPGNIENGYYRLRAYTEHMVYSSPENIFNAAVYVFKEPANASSYGKIPIQTSAVLKEKPDIRFYLEGGNLINGITSVVAFSAFDAIGNPLKITGTVRDDRNTAVTGFQTSPDGLGKLEFFPSKNRTYTANVKLADNTELRFPLPPLDNYAWQLSLLRQDQNSLRFRIGQGDSLYEKKPVSYLLGISRGKVCFAAVGNGMYEINVPVKNFPHGPASFYLFDDQKQKVSERNVFVERKDLKLDVNTGKTNFAARERVKLDIVVTDLEGKPISTVLSVAVTDDKYVSWPAMHSNIHHYIFEKSLHGINYPDTILNHAIAAEKRDLLMLFAGDLYKKSASPVQTKDDEGLEIKGKVLNKKDEPSTGDIATIFADQLQLVLADTIDASGRFNYPPMDFYDKTPFLMHITNERGAKQDAYATADPLPRPKLPELPPVNYVVADKDYQNALSRFSRSGADSFLLGRTRQKLEQIEYESVHGKREVASRENRNKSSRMITGEQLDKLELSNTVNAVLMLPGVIMMNNRLTIRGGLQGVIGNLNDIEPMVVVDGIPSNPGSVVDYLNSFAPNNLDYIEVLTGPEAALYGTRGGNGVIVLKTANNLRPRISTDQKGVNYIYPQGYHLAPEFYFPPYDIYEIRWADFMDDRSTFYWNGEILTDSTGKATVNFYTGDLPGTYTITITGVTSKGDLIHQSMKIDRR